MNFPSVDPIPIPAPVWLMKLLGIVTLALHFAAVMVLVGSLILVIRHCLGAKSDKSGNHASAAYVLARRLPVLMTFVINLGVPPLLFAQVLYGRAIYSSSVLIGALWISVIFQVMLAYWLIYSVLAWMESGKAAWIPALFALLVVMGIGQVYSFNMTLMLRPEVWKEMYAADPFGLQSPKGDPTVTPRWLFIMAGGLMFGGVWSILHSNMKHIGDGVRNHLAVCGGRLAAVGVILQIVCGYLVVSKQPAQVNQAMGSNMFATAGAFLFVLTAVVTLLLGAVHAIKGVTKLAFGVVGLLTAFLATAGATLYRDNLRDVTLLGKGYDVWQRTEVSNWSVVGLFLLLFIIMLGVVYWLFMVMRQATPPKEELSV